MKIGIVSDTHGLLRPEVIEALVGCEAILHGGDINSRALLDLLGEIAPVYVVRGNNDKEWAENIPESLDFETSRRTLVHTTLSCLATHISMRRSGRAKRCFSIRAAAGRDVSTRP